MARHGVKQEDVFLACEQLAGKGVAITAANVRAELGTGSYGTILPFIHDFQTKRIGPSASVSAVLAARGASLAQELWNEASAEWTRKVEELETAHATESAVAKAEISLRAKELAGALAEISELKKQLGKTEQDFEKSKGLVNKLGGELSALGAKLKKQEEDCHKSHERAAVAEYSLSVREIDVKIYKEQIAEMQKSLTETKGLVVSKDVELMFLRSQAKRSQDEAQQALVRAVGAEKELELLQKNDARSRRADGRPPEATR